MVAQPVSRRAANKADAPTADGSKVFTRSDLAKNNGVKGGNKYISIDGGVYEITEWARKHPGGPRIIRHYEGQDASDAFAAFHADREHVAKFLKPLYRGTLAADAKKGQKDAAIEDFRKLRASAEDRGLLKPNLAWFAAHFLHIVALEVAAWFVATYYLTTLGWWGAFASAILLLTVTEAQSGWFQHDIGHMSVFKNSTIAMHAHRFVICFLKAASAHWWNYRHFQHHAKPNIAQKDPDVSMIQVFVLGKTLPVEWGKKHKWYMPYHWQHVYFHVLMPGLLLPLYFPIDNLMHVFRNKQWAELGWMLAFFAKHFAMFTPAFGWGGATGLYMAFRVLESHWFVWVTQANHIPMRIQRDGDEDWLTMQLAGTCNIDQSAFNDWFTGHLNFQIEHHLFPRMPRHNFHKVAPEVEALCKRHDIPYVRKGLWQAFADIPTSLKESGELCYDAYYGA